MQRKVREIVQKLPLWIRGLIINMVALLLLLAVFYMTGNYLYGPAKTARAYCDAKLSEDWNKVYDNCKLPDSKFLSRKIFVNANSYQEEGTKKKRDKKEMTSYMLRKQKGDAKRSTYKVSYSLKDDGESYSDNLVMTQGESVLHWFHNWYVLPEDLYLKDIKLTVPEKAKITVDGICLSGGKPSEDKNLAIYKLPYMFRGNHTIELKEAGKETYQEIFEIDNQRSVEVVPEFALSNESGREISERAEQAVNEIFKATSGNQSFSKVSQFFAEDSFASAESDFNKLKTKFSTKKRAGISTLSVTRITTSVKNNKEDKMSAEIEIRYTVQEVKRRFFFFYKDKNYSDTESLKVRVAKEDDRWVFDHGIIPLLEKDR